MLCLQILDLAFAKLGIHWHRGLKCTESQSVLEPRLCGWWQDLFSQWKALSPFQACSWIHLPFVLAGLDCRFQLGAPQLLLPQQPRRFLSWSALRWRSCEIMVRPLPFKLGSALQCAGCHLQGAMHCMKPAPAKAIQNVRGVSCPWMLKFDALQETSAVASA